MRCANRRDRSGRVRIFSCRMKPAGPSISCGSQTYDGFSLAEIGHDHRAIVSRCCHDFRLLDARRPIEASGYYVGRHSPGSRKSAPRKQTHGFSAERRMGHPLKGNFESRFRIPLFASPPQQARPHRPQRGRKPQLRTLSVETGDTYVVDGHHSSKTYAKFALPALPFASTPRSL